MARSAGTYAQLTSREGRYAIIKLPSGESRMVLVAAVQLLVLLEMQIMDLKDQEKPVEADGWGVVHEFVA